MVVGPPVVLGEQSDFCIVGRDRLNRGSVDRRRERDRAADSGKAVGVEEIGARPVTVLEPLKLGEVELATDLDGVRPPGEGHIILDQRLVLVIVLGEIYAAENQHLRVVDAGRRSGSAVGHDIRRASDVRNRAVGRRVARDEQLVQPVGAAVGPPHFVAIFVVAVPRRRVRGRRSAIDLQVRLVPNERAQIDGVRGRRKVRKLSEIQLLVEGCGEAAVVQRPGRLRIRLRGRWKETQVADVVDVDVVRPERLVRALEVDEERQLLRDDRAANVATVIFGAEIRLGPVRGGGIVEMTGPIIVILADERLGLPFSEDFAMELIAASLRDRRDHRRT